MNTPHSSHLGKYRVIHKWLLQDGYGLITDNDRKRDQTTVRFYKFLQNGLFSWGKKPTNKQTKSPNKRLNWQLCFHTYFQFPLWSWSPARLSCPLYSSPSSWLLLELANKTSSFNANVPEWKYNPSLIKPRVGAAGTRQCCSPQFPGPGLSQGAAARWDKGSICGTGPTSIPAQGILPLTTERKAFKVSPSPNELWISIGLGPIAYKSHTGKQTLSARSSSEQSKPDHRAVMLVDYVFCHGK